MLSIKELNVALDRIALGYLESPERTRLDRVRLTLPRARLRMQQHVLFLKNRRDCWGFVHGKSPLEVKRLIWQHEQEELVCDPRCGTDHITLAVRQGMAVGLTEEAMRDPEPIAPVRAALYGWLHLASSRPWLEAYTASAVLERNNDNRLAGGRGAAQRMGEKWVRELGLKWEDLPDNRIHSTADEEHSDMMAEILAKYATTEEDQAMVLRGARESEEIAKAFMLGVAVAMEAMEG